MQPPPGSREREKGRSRPGGASAPVRGARSDPRRHTGRRRTRGGGPSRGPRSDSRRRAQYCPSRYPRTAFAVRHGRGLGRRDHRPRTRFRGPGSSAWPWTSGLPKSPPTSSTLAPPRSSGRGRPSTRRSASVRTSSPASATPHPRLSTTSKSAKRPWRLSAVLRPS